MAGFKPKEEKSGFGVAQQKGTATSHETTQTATAAPSQEPHVETPEEKAARIKEERRQKRHAEASAKHREERHQKKAEKQNIDLNQEALGVSIAPDINMSVAPCTSLTGAGDGSVGPLSESQDNTVKIGISLYYSIFEEDELFGDDLQPLGTQIKEKDSGEMNYHEEGDYDGTPVSENVDKHFYLFVDCSDCNFSEEEEKISDPEGLQACLEKGMTQLLEIIDSYKSMVRCEISINIGGYDLTKELVGVTKYLLTGEFPKYDITEAILLAYGVSTFQSRILELNFLGFSIRVSYTCIYKAFCAFGDGEEARRKARAKAEYERQKANAMLAPPGAAGTALVQRVNKLTEGMEYSLDTSTVLHLIFAVGSLCIFWPPVAIACVIADMALYALECAIAFHDRDRDGAISAMKGLMLDGFFIFPFQKIANGIRKLGRMTNPYEKAFVAEEKLNSRIAARQKAETDLAKLGTEEERIARVDALGSKHTHNQQQLNQLKHAESNFNVTIKQHTNNAEKLRADAAQLDIQAQGSQAKADELKTVLSSSGRIAFSRETIAMTEGELLRNEELAVSLRMQATEKRKLAEAEDKMRERYETLQTHNKETQQRLTEENNAITQELGNIKSTEEQYSVARAEERYAKDEFSTANVILRQDHKWAATRRMLKVKDLLWAIRQGWQNDKFRKTREVVVLYTGTAFPTNFTAEGIAGTVVPTLYHNQKEGTTYFATEEFVLGDISEVAQVSAGEAFADIITSILFAGPANNAY